MSAFRLSSASARRPCSKSARMKRVSHATSAARYLQECLPVNEYWDVPVAAQTADTAPTRILGFLQAHG